MENFYIIVGQVVTWGTIAFVALFALYLIWLWFTTSDSEVLTVTKEDKKDPVYFGHYSAE